MTEIRPVGGASVWRGADLARREDWIVPLPEALLSELAEAARDASARGGTGTALDAGRYRLDMASALAEDVRARLGGGHGFCLLRGLPVDRFPLDELKMILLILGDHLGLVGPQEDGPRSIGQVMDTGPDRPKHFYYHRGGALPMHMDPVDVVGLMCVRQAKHGGESGIVSAMAVHNALLAERPDLLRILYRGFRRLKRHTAESRQRRELTEEPIPVYAEIGGGELICTFLTEAVTAGVRAGLMALDDAEQEAIAIMERTAARSDLMLPMNLVPGDIQLLNNRVILHNRFDYEDYPEADRRRLMLRLWVSIPEWRKFPPHIPYLDVETGRLPE